MTKGTILNTKRFEIHDGPGIRTTLFLKGCPLNCRWCHNPESFSQQPQLAFYLHKCTNCGLCAAACPSGAQKITDGRHVFDRSKCAACGACTRVCPSGTCMLFGREVYPEELLPELLEDEDFFSESGGGITISGGEPLMQATFTKELLSLLKARHIHTALDTSLYASREDLEKVIPHTDLFLVDVKAWDEETHKTCTGVSNRKILSNLQYLDTIGAQYEIRIPFIPGCNDDQIEKIGSFLASLHHIKTVKLLPYHDLSRTKYDALGKTYPMGSTPIPDIISYQQALFTLRSFGLNAVSSKD